MYVADRKEGLGDLKLAVGLDSPPLLVAHYGPSSRDESGAIFREPPFFSVAPTRPAVRPFTTFTWPTGP